MNKLIIAALCALAIAGCGGNQQKLETCMAEAAKTFYLIHEAGKRDRLEAEERCVKLYK